MDEYYAIEKFTRCVNCRSFSLKSETGGIPGRLRGSIFVCRNCGTRYVFQGNALEEIDHFISERKPEPKEKEPVRMKRNTPRKTAAFLFAFLALVVLGMIFLLHPWNRDPEPTAPSSPGVEKKGIPFEQKESVSKEKKKEVNLVPAVITGEEQEESEETLRIDPPDETVEPDNQALDNTGEGSSHKIFDFSGLKVRRSSPDFSDKSRQWNFSRKRLTIQRSKTQRVMIAGDPTGKSRWAVDDDIIINGERIKGVSGEMTEPGTIPHSKRILPYDITYLVPADRETVLDIRLVDYGIVWGNTSLYIVILQEGGGTPGLLWP